MGYEFKRIYENKLSVYYELDNFVLFSEAN